MFKINKQLNSTNESYRREKNYYVSINYRTPMTQYKKSVIVHIKKTFIKNNISGTLTKMYSEHEQTYKTELSTKTSNHIKSLTVFTKKIHPRCQSGF